MEFNKSLFSRLSLKYVRIGDLDYVSTKFDAAARQFMVAEIFFHPFYTLSNYNDIALLNLQLNSMKTFDQFVWLIWIDKYQMISLWWVGVALIMMGIFIHIYNESNNNFIPITIVNNIIIRKVHFNMNRFLRGFERNGTSLKEKNIMKWFNCHNIWKLEQNTVLDLGSDSVW